MVEEGLAGVTDDISLIIVSAIIQSKPMAKSCINPRPLLAKIMFMVVFQQFFLHIFAVEGNKNRYIAKK